MTFYLHTLFISFFKKIIKYLTFFMFCVQFSKTSTIRPPRADLSEIAQKPRCHLGSESFSHKNRVWINVYKGLCDFWGKLSGKKSLAQFAFGFEGYEPRLHWVQNRHSRNIPSRLKGIETGSRLSELQPRLQLATYLPV